MKSFFYIFLFIAFTPIITFAQLIPSGSTVNIVTAPRLPEPNSVTHISLDAYTINTTGAEIIWYVDGVEQTSVRNYRNFDLTTKNLGESTDVSVRILLANGQALTENITIIPARVDLIIEANTLVPGFYKGRPLPSPGSIARVVAVPNNGTYSAPSDFTYIWKLNGNVLYGGSLKGRNVAEFELSIDKNQILSVDVLNPQGATIAYKSIVVPLTEPELHFYEENPLRGIHTRELASPFILTGDETTVRAEPYYMSENIFQTNPLIEWELDGMKISNPSSDPQYITLRRTEGSGSAQLHFHIRNLSQFLQGVKGGFTVQF